MDVGDDPVKLDAADKKCNLLTEEGDRFHKELKIREGDSRYYSSLSIQEDLLLDYPKK